MLAADLQICHNQFKREGIGSNGKALVSNAGYWKQSPGIPVRSDTQYARALLGPTWPGGSQFRLV